MNQSTKDATEAVRAHEAGDIQHGEATWGQEKVRPLSIEETKAVSGGPTIDNQPK